MWFFDWFYACIIDIQTANIAKQALEGHCIYEGGFCKLHLTYSRHTDLNVKVILDHQEIKSCWADCFHNLLPTCLRTSVVLFTFLLIKYCSIMIG